MSIYVSSLTTIVGSTCSLTVKYNLVAKFCVFSVLFWRNNCNWVNEIQNKIFGVLFCKKISPTNNFGYNFKQLSCSRTPRPSINIRRDKYDLPLNSSKKIVQVYNTKEILMVC